MKQFDQLPFSDLTGAIEDFAKRKPNSKEFDFGGGKRRLVQSIRRLHYEDGGAQHDIDLTPVDLGDRWRIDQAPYIVEIRKDRLEFTYTSRRGGSVTVSASNIGGPPLVTPVVDESEGTHIRFDDVRPGLDIYFEFTPNTVRIFKVLKSPAAPVEFTWDVKEDEGAAFSVMSSLVGFASKLDGLKRRKLDLTRTVGPVLITNGVKSYTVTERFNGRASEIFDPVTRRKEWKTDLVYPLVIDPDITENITDTADDVYSWENGSFAASPNNIYAGHGFGSDFYAGLRFQTINLDKAVTIDLANLIVEIAHVANTPVTKVFGDDVDDAPVFSTGDRVKNITQTTASTDFDPTTTGSKTVDITSIVQELVDRDGWSANNDMRFALFDDGGGAYDYFGVEDFSKDGGTPAVLEIDFTAGTVPTINLVTAPYIPA